MQILGHYEVYQIVEFRVPDLAEKTIGYPIKFEFQRNSIFGISISFAIFGAFLYQNVFVVYLTFRLI